MDSDGLPIVGAGIDYSKVDPFHQKRTLTFLNHFLIRTTSFLNHFSTICDEKLENLLVRIQRLEASMCILEAKLTSIPGLDDILLDGPTRLAEASPNQPTVPNVPTNEAANLPPDAIESEQAKPIVTSDDKPKMKISQDPRFSKYFKMVIMGVPAMAVKQKMSSEGVNPDILDDPEAETIEGYSAEMAKQSSSNSESSDLSN